MNDEELYEALVERSVMHEFVSEVYLLDGELEHSILEQELADTYMDMAKFVFKFENVCLPE